MPDVGQNIARFRFRNKKYRDRYRSATDRNSPPLTAIKAQDGIPDWSKIEKLLKEWQPDLVVVGLPLNMDGTEQPLTARARKFANRLHGRFGVAVELQDERLSTVEARADLFEHGGYKALSKGNVDSGSAVIILESWFDHHA